jgi:hypothetical protein
MRKSINEIFHIEMDYIANTRINLYLFLKKNNSALSGYTGSDEKRSVSTEGTCSPRYGVRNTSIARKQRRFCMFTAIMFTCALKIKSDSQRRLFICT